MKADALMKIGIDPLQGMAQYKEAAKYLADMKLDNPQIPSALPEDTVIPGVTPPAGASGTNTRLAPGPEAAAPKPETGTPTPAANGH